MKFVEGMIIGGILATGATLMYTNNYNKANTKKMMKKGRQFVKKMGII